MQKVKSQSHCSNRVETVSMMCEGSGMVCILGRTQLCSLLSKVLKFIERFSIMSKKYGNNAKIEGRFLFKGNLRRRVRW